MNSTKLNINVSGLFCWYCALSHSPAAFLKLLLHCAVGDNTITFLIFCYTVHLVKGFAWNAGVRCVSVMRRKDLRWPTIHIQVFFFFFFKKQPCIHPSIHPSIYTHSHTHTHTHTHTHRQLPSHSVEAGVCKSHEVWWLWVFSFFFSSFLLGVVEDGEIPNVKVCFLLWPLSTRQPPPIHPYTHTHKMTHRLTRIHKTTHTTIADREFQKPVLWISNYPHQNCTIVSWLACWHHCCYNSWNHMWIYECMCHIKLQ